MYFIVILPKNNPLRTDPRLFWKCKCFFITVIVTVNSLQTTISLIIFPCVCISTHFNEYSNEIIYCSHAGFNILVRIIFTKEVLMINTWVWAVWCEAQWSSMNKMITICSDNGKILVVDIGYRWSYLCLGL